ncbi:hypothetical protein [Parasphingorhabdus cellanae]|uniref:DUF1801 domain-containing protein n=1 Tax=Parasphingorhabdus cellanae TaxID=2806553 RepID=A0ABX7TA61_9SPHN|nr:hypothetical protein [Parasphingorhabdus cellanae]QTD57058.1 hypothetical protein J4G78_05725 [Parasphingorhabdus cellanae]
MEKEFIAIFLAVRSLYAAYDKQCVVTHDDKTRYHLGSHEVRERDGYRTDFGGVEIKKNYVSVHLMPVYIYPDMLQTISGELKKRMQGKSCFNLTTQDTQLISELGDLIAIGIARYKEDGRL